MVGFAAQFGLELPEPLLGRLVAYLGGRPFLTHLFLYELARDPAGGPRLLEPANAPTGPFRDHLHRFLMRFQRAPELARAMSAIAHGRDVNDDRALERLDAAGLVVQRADGYRPACELYAAFFGRELGPP